MSVGRIDGTNCGKIFHAVSKKDTPASADSGHDKTMSCCRGESAINYLLVRDYLLPEDAMPQQNDTLLTQSEAAAVAEVPVKAVYKTVAERLPKALLARRAGKTFLTPEALICVRLDYDLPKDVPIKVRRFVYGKMKSGKPDRVEYGSSVFSYVIDPRPAARTIGERMRRYRKAMQLIVEDPEIQGGIATFKGTRLPVYQIGSLLQQGATEKELREDYPNLTPEMIEAARIYVQANPRRGRPRKPAWHGTKPLSSRLIRRRSA
jgi:uncharacterized protein (DUF433 family)